MEHFQKARDMVGSLLLLIYCHVISPTCHVISLAMSCDLPGRVMLTGSVGWACSTSLVWESSRYATVIVKGKNLLISWLEGLIQQCHCDFYAWDHLFSKTSDPAKCSQLRKFPVVFFHPCVTPAPGLYPSSGVFSEGSRQGLCRGSVLSWTHVPWYVRVYTSVGVSSALRRYGFFVCYSEGHGTKYNLNKALRYFQLASHGGKGLSMHNCCGCV